jgi:hypothetical protein
LINRSAIKVMVDNNRLKIDALQVTGYGLIAAVTLKGLM